MSDSLDLITDAQGHMNVISCTADGDLQNDDPCLKLPCSNNGRCLSKQGGGFTCVCPSNFIGKFTKHVR